jgi:hypothetical protein
LKEGLNKNQSGLFSNTDVIFVIDQ